MVAVPELPLVSLIMTVHNRDRYLPIAIESVLVQTESNFELILWDDGSTDRSLELMQHYAQQDDRIRLFSTKHQGRAQALKAAHAEARGRYIGWIDSDDVLSPIALEKTVPILERSPQMGLVYTNYRVIDECNRVYEVSDRCSIPYSPKQMLVDCGGGTGKVFDRAEADDVGGERCCCAACAVNYLSRLKMQFPISLPVNITAPATIFKLIHHHSRNSYAIQVNENQVNSSSIGSNRNYLCPPKLQCDSSVS